MAKNTRPAPAGFVRKGGMPTKYELCSECGNRKREIGKPCERCQRIADKAAMPEGTQTKKHEKVLRHRVKKADTHQQGAFDIETDFEGNYLGGYVGWDDQKYVYCQSMSEMVDVLLTRRDVIYYAHYACNMELNYVINELVGRDLSIQMIKQGTSRIIGMIIDLGKDDNGKRHTIELRDSFAIIPMSLKAATATFCDASNQKGSHDFGKDEYERRKDARGNVTYGKVPRNMEAFLWNPDSAEDREYCRQDVQSTMSIVSEFRRIVKEAFGVEIGWTASSTAMNAFQAMIPAKVSYWRLEPEDERFCRGGYYGGFVHTGHDILKHKDQVSVDRNAAYVAAMREPLPCGPASFCYDYEGKPGLYSCRVTPGDIPFSFIPCRSEHGLLWPRGGTGSLNGNQTTSTWMATLTAPEIDFARDHGYDIKVIEGRSFEKMESPLAVFSETIETLVLSKPEWKPVLKLVGNGLYGKFGTKLDIEETCIAPTCPGQDWEQCVDDKTGQSLLNVWVRTAPCDAAYIMPHWAAYICAKQRLWIFETVMAVGPAHVQYCDTDSVKADRWAIEAAIARGDIDIHPMRYGACKIDEEYDWFQSLGPKVYWGDYTDGYVVANKKKGVKKRKMRAKGIPGYALIEEMFKDVLDGDFYATEFESWVSSGVRLVKPNLPIRRASSRKLSNIRESKTRHITDEGKILMPLVYDGIVLDEIA